MEHSNKTFKWQKEFFRNRISLEIEENEKINISKVKGKFNYTMNIDGVDYIIRITNLLNGSADIINESTGETIGNIVGSFWRSEAKINLFDNESILKFKNMLYSKWKVTNTSGEEIFYSSKDGSGEITSNANNTLLTATGLVYSSYCTGSLTGGGSIAFLILMFIIIFM